MPLPKLMLVPDANGYQSTEGNSAIYVALAGGAGRARLDKIGAAKTVEVSWTMNPDQYQYWRAFWRTAVKEGTLAFLCDLLSEDGSGATEHECRFIPGSVVMPSQYGLVYVQKAQLEVLPLPTDAVMDTAILMLFETSAGDPSGWFDALELLVLDTMPVSLGAI